MRRRLPPLRVLGGLLAVLAVLAYWSVLAADGPHPAAVAGPAPARSPAIPATQAAPKAIAQRRVVPMTVTAYCPCTRCCGRHADGITASGKSVRTNGSMFVAGDRSLPFGTRLIVPGYAGGSAVPVLDRGGAIKGSRLDVFFPTHQQARQWGVRHVDVTILP